MSATPYVSFVTYGRNDGYTPGYAARARRATACLARQLDHAGIDSEIVFIEWNPPADRPLLIELLEVPDRLRHVTVRAFIVPRECHDRFPRSQEAGFYAGEAANAGLRRARGRFATPKASDSFFSQEVIDLIARRDLDPDTMYRIDRHDVAIENESIWDLSDDALLAKLGTLPSSPHAWIDQKAHWGLRNLHTNACGDFTLMSLAYWHYLRGHPADRWGLSLDIDSLVMHAAAALGVIECRWPDSCRVYKPTHGRLHNFRIQQSWRPWQRALERFLSEKISENAAFRARILFDYPRRKVAGAESVVGPSIERNFVHPASRWAKGEKPVPTQPENWGLRDSALEQRLLCRAAWDEISPSYSR
jgi:hypothetical protein